MERKAGKRHSLLCKYSCAKELYVTFGKYELQKNYGGNDYEDATVPVDDIDFSFDYSSNDGGKYDE